MKYGVFILWMMVSAIPALAVGTIFVSASAPEISMDDELQITYRIENASVSRFTPPDFSPFEVIYGPAKSQSYSIINGKISRQVSYTFGLRPGKAGTFSIGSASALLNGDPVKSNIINVTVTAGAVSQSPQTNTQMPDAPRRNDKWQDKVFVLVTADKSTLWEGEQVILTYTLYYLARFDNVQILKTPSYNGFLLHDFKLGQPPEQIVSYKGREYYSQTFKKVALFPNMSGKVSVPPIELECSVYEEERDPFFDDPFFSRSNEKRIALRSNEVVFDVKPLPSVGRPDGFRGAVGNFTLEANMDNTTIRTGDGATLKAVIKGTGNIHLAQMEKPQMPVGIDIYDPQVKESISKNNNTLSGSKSFEFILIPSAVGKYEIPPVQFSYFDPQAGEYKTLSSQPTTLTVEKGLDTPVADHKSTSSGWKSLLATGLKIVGYAVGIALIVLLLIGGIVFYFYRKRKKKRATSKENKPISSLATQKTAPIKSIPQTHFEAYSNLMSAYRSGNIAAQYALLPQVLWEEIQKRDNQSGIYDRQKLFASMQDIGAQEKKATEELLAQAEMQQYGGGLDQDSMLKDKEKLEGLISRLQATK